MCYEETKYSYFKKKGNLYYLNDNSPNFPHHSLLYFSSNRPFLKFPYSWIISVFNSIIVLYIYIYLYIMISPYITLLVPMNWKQHRHKQYQCQSATPYIVAHKHDVKLWYYQDSHIHINSFSWIRTKLLHNLLTSPIIRCQTVSSTICLLSFIRGLKQSNVLDWPVLWIGGTLRQMY